MMKFGVGITVVLFLSAAVPYTAEAAALKPPGRIVVPKVCLGESFAVGWSPSQSPLVDYQLQQAADAGFTTGVRTVYRGRQIRVPLTGGISGETLYYRVRATRRNYTSSPWVPGANGVLIKRTTGVPASVTVPAASATGSYQVSWGASATPGAVYDLEEATAPDFSVGLRTAYHGGLLAADIAGRADATTYFYRVRATRNGWYPSAWVAGANGCTVALADVTPPGPVTDFTATPAPGQVTLAWVNPADADLAGVRVVRRTDGYPAAADDGDLVCDGPGTGCTDAPLDPGTYYYAAFARDAAPNYSIAATATAVVAEAATCVSCHNGNPSFPLAPNVVNGPLPGSPGLSYNWYGSNATRQEGGHGDPQGRDIGQPPGCTDCHDISIPPGTHADGTLQSPFNAAPRNANTSHLKAIYFDTERTAPPKPVGAGAWSIQVAFDNYCAYSCHTDRTTWVTQTVPNMRHEQDTAPTDPHHWSVEMGTHLTAPDGDTLPGGASHPVDYRLNTNAAGLPDYATCVSCHDPHGTTVVEPGSPLDNRMLRRPWIDSTLCGACHQ